MFIIDLDSMTLDGNTFFPFKVHIIKNLILHFSFTDCICGLQ